MIRHYLFVTLRRLNRQPGYTVINVLGLALGLSCALLTFLFVRSELSFDRMHEKADRIHRIEMVLPQGGSPQRWSATLAPLADEVRNLAGVEHVARLRSPGSPMIARTGTETRFYEDKVLTTEPSFFDIFDFPILKGTAEDLSRPNIALISEDAALKYFGDDDPIGQTISLFEEWDAGSIEYEVVGLIQNMPANVHVRADILLSLATDFQVDDSQRWRQMAYTYVALTNGASAESFSKLLTETVSPFASEHLSEGTTVTSIPLTRIHLHGLASSDIVPQGDIRYVYLFSAIAFLVLLIACINYVNLATAQAARRAREVGVRKTVGARRGQLVAQFLGESIVLTAGSVAVALLLVSLVMPTFNALTGKSLVLPWDDVSLWTAVACSSLFVGFVAGAYPALVLSGFRPASVLKGSVKVQSIPALRKGLTITQFAISIGLILCTIVIQRQLQYVQQTRLGFDKDELLVVRARTALPAASAASFQHAIAALPGVIAVSRSSGIPGEPTAISFYDETEVEDFEGAVPVFDHFWVDDGFAAVLGLELVAGRFFDPEQASDEQRAIILNEASVKALGWADPIGKRLGSDDGAQTVVGVVRDFHYADMRTKIGPVIIDQSTSARRYYSVRFRTADVSGLLTDLEETWRSFIPDHPFNYSFLRDDFAAMYRAEQRLGRLFIAFAVLAILIACLGLFGLTAFMMQQRTKEIGIRKVLGASAQSLLLLLSKDMLWLLAIAFAFAGPPAYLAMRKWLANFAYHTTMRWDVFVIAGIVSLVITVVAISFHLVRAAKADPVKSLRYE